MNTNVSPTNSYGTGDTTSTSSSTKKPRQSQSDFSNVMKDKEREREHPKGPRKSESGEAKGKGRSVFDLPTEKKQSKGATKFDRKDESNAQPQPTPDKKSEPASKSKEGESAQPVDSASETTSTKGGAETPEKGQQEPKTFVVTTDDKSTGTGKAGPKKPDPSGKGTSSEDVSVGDEPIQTPSSATSKAKGETTSEGKAISDPADTTQPKQPKPPSATTETADALSAPKQETAPREGSPSKQQTEHPDLVRKVLPKEETMTKKEAQKQPGEPKTEQRGETDKLAADRSRRIDKTTEESSLEPKRGEEGTSKKEKGKGDGRTGASDQEMAGRVVVTPQSASTDVQTTHVKSSEPPPAPSTIKEIASQIVEQMQVMRRDGHVTTQITLRNPPILEGATITLVSPDNAKKEVSISFANLSPEAKAFLDRAMTESPLSQALENKGIVVHALTTTTQAEPLIPSQAGQSSQEQREQQQGGGGQQQGREQSQEGEEEEG